MRIIGTSHAGVSFNGRTGDRFYGTLPLPFVDNATHRSLPIKQFVLMLARIVKRLTVIKKRKNEIHSLNRCSGYLNDLINRLASVL